MTNGWTAILTTALAMWAAALLLGAAASDDVRPRVAGETLLVTAMLAGVAALAALIGVVLSLGRPELVFAAFANPESVLFRELTAGILLAVTLAGFVVSVLRGCTARCVRAWRIAAGLSAVLFAAAAASGFVMPWRAAWRSIWTAVSFLGFALVMAGAVREVLLGRAMRLSAKKDRRIGFDPKNVRNAGSAGDMRPDANVTSRLHWLPFIALLPPMIWIFTVASAAPEAVASALSGPAAPCFWGALLTGALIPTALLTLHKRRPEDSPSVFPAIVAVLSSALSPILWAVMLQTVVDPEAIRRLLATLPWSP